MNTTDIFINVTFLRFLLKDTNSGMWFDVGEVYAREKVSHALRSRPNEERRRNLTTKEKLFPKAWSASWIWIASTILDTIAARIAQINDRDRSISRDTFRFSKQSWQQFERSIVTRDCFKHIPKTFSPQRFGSITCVNWIDNTYTLSTSNAPF